VVTRQEVAEHKKREDNDEDGDDDDMILLEQCVERLVTVHVPGSGAVRAAALTYADGIVSENSGNIVYTAQHRRPDHFKALLFNVQPGAEAPEINLIDPVPCVVHSVLRQSVLNTADSKRSDNCLAFDVAQSRLTYSSMNAPRSRECLSAHSSSGVLRRRSRSGLQPGWRGCVGAAIVPEGTQEVSRHCVAELWALGHAHRARL